VLKNLVFAFNTTIAITDIARIIGAIEPNSGTALVDCGVTIE